MSKQSVYENLLRELDAVLVGTELDRTAGMATTVAVLHEGLDYFDWTGFYRVTKPEHLQIGPYQGHLACLDIPFQRGVCGACATQGQTIIVPDVRKFPGYIACDAKTLSEIVVPVIEHGKVTAVLDIDCDKLAAFDAVDQTYLEKIVAVMLRYC